MPAVLQGVGASLRFPSPFRSTSQGFTPGACGYAYRVKTIWTGRMAQAAGKYGDNAPMAAVCCNACRTCVTTNILGILTAGVASAGYAAANIIRRRSGRPFRGSPAQS
jgi:hypothetical protein